MKACFSSGGMSKETAGVMLQLKKYTSAQMPAHSLGDDVERTETFEDAANDFGSSEGVVDCSELAVWYVY